MVPSYRVREELARDGQYVLHRGEVDGEAPVLVKTPVSPSPPAAAVAALRREHELLRELDIDGTPRVRAFDLQRPALIVEDIGATPLATLLAAGRFPLSEFFTVALELVTTVGELHRRRIIHRNLSPCGILVNPRTRRAQVFDLGLASRLPQETQPDGPPQLLPGRLAYMSPEQTGRMNRVVDYRTDLYSLGATLYEMLTGQPPFASDDPLELVHGHIARAPREPRQVDPTVPEALSEIVMKLLSKTAEARYQSAWGLKADLERCAEQWASERAVRRFPLGEADFSDRFTIPQHLYGREGEIRILLDAFERACAGRASLMLVTGYSGIGKTSLVQEIQKPIVELKGRFVSGKYDQLERSTPYSALLQALRGLVRQLLPESEERLAALRERLAHALGGNGGVVAAVIPELDLLLGPQPAPPPLPPAESRNRFNYVLENFLGALARPEHPLVVFLDDLQWADSASLQLLGRLLTGRSVRSLFLIGAYRDNEVTPDHPLIKALGEIRDAGAAVEEMALPNLGRHDVRLLVRDAVHGEAPVADALADLVHRKTGGNPFFATQFLKSLHENRLIELDQASRAWRFDLARIEGTDITDNVVDLMTKKLRTLAGPTQEAITLAACIGNRFSLSVLATVRQKTLREVASELWGAIEEGLVLPTTEGYEPLAGAPEEVLENVAPSYRFLHDRVQQAAWALIPEDQRKPVHLRVGRLLLAGCQGEPPADRLFEIVNHLNFGHELIEGPEERARLARLDLEAGRRAKDSAAFRAALDYFERGLDLLPPDRWAAHYDLALALTMEVAEGDYLCGRPHLYTKPRNFTTGKFKVRTTPSGALPTHQDLVNIIRRGMPYSSMPAWPNLSDQQVSDLAYFITTFSPDFSKPDMVPKPVELPAAPKMTPESIEAGKKLFVDTGCVKCHGTLGRGDGPSAPSLVDDLQHPIRPADLTQSWTFRAGSSREDIFRTMTTGFMGAPMPSFIDSLSTEQRWAITDFIVSLSGTSGPGYTNLVTARHVQDPIDLKNGFASFQSAPVARLPIVGQIMEPGRAFSPPATSVTVQAIYDADSIAFLVRWHDMSAEKTGKNGPSLPVPPEEEDEAPATPGQQAPDANNPFGQDAAAPSSQQAADPFAADTGAAATSAPPSEFSDAVAIQIASQVPTGARKPYFIFGDGQNSVDLWFFDLARPEPQQFSGRGSANIEPNDTGDVTGVASYDQGEWSAIFKRPLRPTSGAAFSPGEFMPIAFSVWDGFSRERGNKRGVTLWNSVYVEPEVVPSAVGPMVRTALLILAIELVLIGWVRSRYSSRASAANASPSSQTGYGEAPSH